MSHASWWRTAPVLLLLAACGCESPPMIEVETIIHGDGSCERTIWQPRDKMLPEDALKPAWNARWKLINLAAIPPELARQAGNAQPNDDHHYFSAHGVFRSPAEIPPHFRLTLAEGRDAEASELVRSYECKDYGFVREHRWRETLTNIVTRDKFLKARAEFLDLALPKVVLGIEQVYGKSFDVTGLVQYLRKDGRRFLEQAALVFYDTMVQHLTDEEQGIPYAELARQFGLDLFDPAGNVVSDEEFQTRLKTFLRHRIALGMRHRDGSRLTEPELQSILDQSGNSPFSQAWSGYWKQHEKEFETQLVPRIVQMTGFYNAPFGGPNDPGFVFDLHLPGKIVESSGTIEAPDHTRWKFSGDRSFPDGYIMQARSLEIDLPRQHRVLGRAAMTDTEQAEKYIELLSEDGLLLEGIRKARAISDLNVLLDDRQGSADQQGRRQRLMVLLGVVPPHPAP